MAEGIAIFSRGLWRLSAEVERLSGRTPRLPALRPSPSLEVAGWGHKPTAAGARAYARYFGLTYVAFEDGFLRSLKPGPGQKPQSMVMDRSGIYYDATTASDLETLLEHGEIDDADRAAAAELVAFIARCRLSKYNTGRDEPPDGAVLAGRPLVLLIDQTHGDAAVTGGLGDAASFARMVDAAQAENPGAKLVVKLHPEVMAGTKRGYLRDMALASGLTVLADNLTPHALTDLRPKVYTVSSQFGFEAVLAGCEVHCFGMPFYAGWGLTSDRLTSPRRTRRRSAAELAAAALLRYSAYFDAWTRRPVTALEAAGQLDFLRRHYFGNSRPVIGYRIARWKRRAVAAMLDGPAGPPRFLDDLSQATAEARQRGAALAAWGMTAAALRSAPETRGLEVLAVEDGFMRSTGLGAGFVTPRSLVFDSRGLYYDPARVSDLEYLLVKGGFTVAETDRAECLRQAIVASGVTKYNLPAGGELPALPTDRQVVLVIGQVSDDASVRAVGGDLGNVNAMLLARARASAPGAYVIFKPHPDVERLGRAGALSPEQERAGCDWVARGIAIGRLLPLVHRVETFGSLAGFEALLRGVKVKVYGMPFYAGWGLTEDATTCPRRGQRRTVSELVAAALIGYPRYWEPASGLACPPETALAQLATPDTDRPKLRARILLQAGRGVILWRRLKQATTRRPDDRGKETGG
jgi:capsular polysaccharide export protein